VAPSTQAHKPGRVSRKWWVIAVIAVFILYSWSIASYANSDTDRVQSSPGQVTNGINFGLEPISLDQNEGQITLRTEWVPEGDFVANGLWSKSVRVTMPYVVDDSATVDIAEGTPAAGVQDYSFVFEGNSAQYPFDQYVFGSDGEPESDAPSTASSAEPLPLMIVQEIDAAGRPTNAQIPLGVYLGDGLQGWSKTWQISGDNNELSVLLIAQHSGSVVAFVLVVLMLMAIVALLAVLVARTVVTKRRSNGFEAAGWMTVLIFALIPLRTTLPDSPPIGAWVDIVVFYWVIVAILVSMAVVAADWVKTRNPG